MKQKKIDFRGIFLLLLVLIASVGFAQEGSFEGTTQGVRYIVRDANGAVVQNLTPTFDTVSGNYVVKDEQNNIVAQQPLPQEADMSQIKIVSPVKGDDHSVRAKDFLGNPIPVLKELPANDPRYQQLQGYIDNDQGLKRAISMQLEARNMKIDRLQTQLNEGVRDPKLVSWMINDLKKPVYLEVGDSGTIYHDPKGFMLAEKGPNGQITVRDNSYVNRLVIPPNSEAFQGGMNDSSAASVMAHEVGHMVMDQLYERNNYPKTNYAGQHSKNSVTDEGFAISEGWAEAMETLANKERLDSASSWRIKSQQNIAENKYIFKNQGVVDGVNDGLLKNGGQMLSTEGVNASLFYKMLQDYRIQAPYSKVCQVFEQSKPQNYRDFVKSYVETFPEDRSYVIKQFLENTKYATVDSTAGQRYKSLFDAEQAFKSASDPQVKAQLEADYQTKLSEYNQWKEQSYQQAVVDGKIDRAVAPDGSDTSSYSDNTGKEFRKIKLSETILKSQKALGMGMEKAAQSIKDSFSIRSVAMTAGTSIAMNLAQQIFKGEKVSFKKAFSAVASLQFVGNVLGSTMGAAAGHAIAPLIQTFVPIPIVGALAGALLPALGSITGGQLGGNLGAGQAFKTALKNLDFVSISGQAVGSVLGSMLGAMIPIPVLGPMIGGMVGGWLGQKIFTGIAKLFGYKKNSQATGAPVQMPGIENGPVPTNGPLSLADYQDYGGVDSSSVGLDPSLERIPAEKMPSELRVIKMEYERAYRAYVEAVATNNSALIKERMEKFVQEKNRFGQSLGAFIKSNPGL